MILDCIILNIKFYTYYISYRNVISIYCIIVRYIMLYYNTWYYILLHDIRYIIFYFIKLSYVYII